MLKSMICEVSLLILITLNINNSFYATDLFIYSLKISENQRLPDAFRGYRRAL